MNELLAWALAALVAYLVGAIPFGLLVGRAWKGVDIRQHGSGNLGATNALRVLGKRVGGLVLLLDAAKGALPVLLLPPLVTRLAGASGPSWLPVALATSAVVGHVFPIYLRFAGGKGVATSAGAMLALHPPALGAAFATFALTLALTRIVSLSSLLAALALPLAAVAIDGPELALGEARVRTALFVLLALLVWVRHRANLARLLAGTEPRIGQRAAPTAEGAAPTEPHGGPGTTD